MNVGIIIHTITGKSIRFVERLKEKINSSGHTANIEKIKPPSNWKFGENKNKNKPNFPKDCNQECQQYVLLECLKKLEKQ